MKNSLVLLVLFTLLGGIAHTMAQEKKPYVTSFESSGILGRYEVSGDSYIRLSSDHQRFGNTSLRWEWDSTNSFIETSHLSLLGPDPTKKEFTKLFPASPTFNLSIYSESPQSGTIKVAFYRDRKEVYWFTIPVNFYGWRTIRVPFYEMQGDVPSKTEAVDFDRLRLTGTASEGCLFVDDIVFSQYQDDRHQYPDQIVPFLKKDQDHSIDHWMPLIYNWELLQNMEINPVTKAQKEDMRLVKMRLDSMLLSGMEQRGMAEVVEAFGSLGITEDKGTVKGPPLTFNLQEVYYDSLQQGPMVHNKIRDFGVIIKNMAATYFAVPDDKDQQSIKEKFILAARYYLDQGWQKGSSGGTRHHIGYQTRELTEAFYLMSEPLAEAGLLTEVGNSIKWLGNFGMILDDEEAFNVNIDYLNTQSFNHLASVFLTEGENKKGTLLTAFSNYLSVILAQEDKEWGFKADGTTWHHSGHYPAYGMGAFYEVPKLFYCLSGTTFNIKETGHYNFRRALLTTTRYSHTYDWGFGNAGRHPFGQNSISGLKDAFYLMALSGSPSGDQNVDPAVAGDFLYLWGKEDPGKAQEFRALGIQKSNLPSYKSLPYGATAIHRNGDWAAIIKGYSKYVWSSEIYPASNRYGRYPANGSVQLLSSGGQEASGVVEAGWDWNRFPGTTVLPMPFEELETEMALLMFLSEETFAGATQLEGNGVFGMVLNAGVGKNADGLAEDRTVELPGNLKAKKSVFSFGNKLICIGTGISSDDLMHPVQTNLFQSELRPQHQTITTAAQGTVKGFPNSGVTTKWIIDNYGNGYYLLDSSNVIFSMAKQDSYHNKYSVNTGNMHPLGDGNKTTQGNFATAWIDHGKVPKAESYQYVIYPFMEHKKVQGFGRKAPNDFDILKADEYAHIVEDHTSSTRAYVIFDATKFTGDSLISAISAPSLVMVKKAQGGTLKISAVNPDLNFPDNPKKKNGFDNYSKPVTLTISLEGKWKVIGDGVMRSEISGSENTTSVQLECVDGIPCYLELSKTNEPVDEESILDQAEKLGG
ncbi:hypothetical protein DN752_00855 [Echinicola strongylocentroti]|uniref:Chondroitin ABC lyase n=1 Tax=Echinicola strongylocentroti TaxID=1795355 RepID=A0A2Z4IDF1_9BACT|nr:chondroitinase family polysaccharide lyase [Echinicola strongylocentroti]AWW28795.1 hypothetical protein DN752_00855 [Echinicola strongylocentroti]